MRISICGARGSTPAPGAEFLRYGGHTPCVAISPDGGNPTLVVDAGTGIRKVGDLCEAQTFRGTILLSHLHWDHTQGLPFFTGADQPSSDVRVLLPEQGDPLEVISRAMSPPHFPIGPEGLRGRWSFESLDAGVHGIEGFSVQAVDVPHKGGRTFGFRISNGEQTVTYLSDHDPLDAGPGPDGLGAYHDAALELCRDVDLLIHDAHHTREEFARNHRFGHSAADYAVGLAEEAGVRRLWLFHHAPFRTDDALDRLVESLSGAAVDFEAAAEGLTLDFAKAAT